MSWNAGKLSRTGEDPLTWQMKETYIASYMAGSYHIVLLQEADELSVRHIRAHLTTFGYDVLASPSKYFAVLLGGGGHCRRIDPLGIEKELAPEWAEPNSSRWVVG